jgi:hypothetical protein
MVGRRSGHHKIRLLRVVLVLVCQLSLILSSNSFGALIDCRARSWRRNDNSRTDLVANHHDGIHSESLGKGEIEEDIWSEAMPIQEEIRDDNVRRKPLAHSCVHTRFVLFHEPEMTLRPSTEATTLVTGGEDLPKMSERRPKILGNKGLKYTQHFRRTLEETPGQWRHARLP